MKKDVFKYQILVIEDNLGDFLLVEDYLQEMILDPNIKHCQSFKEVKNLFKDNRTDWDVLLLDLSLPDREGENLIEDILKMAGDIPVIVLTGYTDANFALKSLALGVSDYLLKDELNPTTIHKAITYNIERHKNLKRIHLSEKRYAELFELSPQPMWVFDEETFMFLKVNKATEKTYGYSKEEFLKMDIFQIRRPEETNQIKETLAKTGNKEHKSVFMGIYEHIKKDGSPISVEIHSNIIDFESRKARLIVANDITLKITYLKAIEEQNQRLQEIAWIQSHIVRAPLARMMGLIDLIKHNNLSDEEKHEFLDHVLNSAIELDNIIREIVSKANEIESKDRNNPLT
ncbi:histidine kinase response regulator hybrid protein [Indibacter alkaliphilus LW1]|uniref:Histidine kinase response regulator hybrid protein n=1 Tax=Indibacter alkaliphilus (strain CCUG 57479 / KCTC 22604 / LW1) TaxID=1189612 RepID=S2D812_INDAL|nr:PAS domain S-box protein [Indibacter alkaliphilus]EOZ95357.1 histidine kinase response regulator hybrid protein [Indibacter alkaliphilus LW1]